MSFSEQFCLYWYWHWWSSDLIVCGKKVAGVTTRNETAGCLVMQADVFAESRLAIFSALHRYSNHIGMAFFRVWFMTHSVYFV